MKIYEKILLGVSENNKIVFCFCCVWGEGGIFPEKKGNWHVICKVNYEDVKEHYKRLVKYIISN